MSSPRASTAAAPPPPLVDTPTPWLVSRIDDEYAALPRRAASWAHALREALAPSVVVRPLSLVFVAYASLASWTRARRAGEIERHPELIRKAAASTAIDSAATLWLECVTLPSFALGIITRAAHAAVGGMGAAGSSAPLLVRYGPAAAGVASLPLLLPACSHGADALMQWAFRPAIAYWRTPSDEVLFGDAEYVPPPAEEMLEALAASGGGASAFLIPPDMGALERAQLEWALDGDAASPFPEAIDAAAAAATASAGRGGKGAGGAAGAAAGGGGASGDAAYLIASARMIRERAAARHAAAAAAAAAAPVAQKGQGAPLA